jgi:hypothetical protein
MTGNHSRRTGVHPVMVALAVAVLGALAMLIVDHGPWSRPNVPAADRNTTGKSARAAGAVVAPTAPKPALEPEAPGPRPAQPASPDPH